MTHAPQSARPFAFDTEFDATGQVVVASAWRPTKRTYSPDEVDALVQEARAQIRAEIEAQVQAQQAQALEAIADVLTSAGPRLSQTLQAHREQSVELALVMARQLAGAALNHLPSGMLETALEALAQEIEASPRLQVRACGLDPAAQERVRHLATDVGFMGQVSFREDATLPPAAFELEWSDGRAAFDLDEAADRLREALTSQLAADAGHAGDTPEGGQIHE